MCKQAKEGAVRPLPISAPKNPENCPAGGKAGGAAPAASQGKGNENPSKESPKPAGETAAKAAAPKPAPAPHWLAAALCSYPLAYLYVRVVLFYNIDTKYGLSEGWGVPLFAALFLLWVELFARADRRAPTKETAFWAVCWLAQSVALPLWGWQGGGLATWQYLLWHVFAVWYVLARTGMLAAGHTGSLFFLDGAAGAFTLPWGSIVQRIATLVRSAGAGLCRARRQGGGQGRLNRLGVLAASAAAALAACLYAGAQLAAADPNFAALGSRLTAWLNALGGRVELGEFLVYLILSLPVGAWLFGLVAGGLRRSEAPVSSERFFAAIGPWQRLPGVTVCMVLGALCAMYGVFFALQVAAFAGAVGRGSLTGSQVSTFAVDGFWELCRVLLLDLGLLACIRFFGPALGRNPRVRALQTVFAAFGAAFAALAAAKLGFYIGRYGWTPRRALSGWFLCVLAVWAVLALVWVRGWPAAKFGPAQAGVLVLAASFTLLCCVNMNGLVLRANLARDADGMPADVQTLRACGAGSYEYHGEEYAALLAESGWFVGRNSEEICELYFFEPDSLDEEGCGTVQILPNGSESESVLVLEFDGGRCTGSFVSQRAGAAL